jgi:hypothetical protein
MKVIYERIMIAEVAPGTSEDDREARALLNKFLGAQVLLQGMEPLVAAQSPALVSQVERQRIVTSTTTSSAKVSVTFCCISYI